jgi:hypothetical protein
MKSETTMHGRSALVSLHATPDVPQRLLELLAFLLSDVDTDIGVAARDLGIADASFVRLQRARDRVACAQRLLEEALPAVSDRTASSVAGPSLEADGGTESEVGAIGTAMREAVELLAREWPEDYPAGAVEWLAVQEGRAKRVGRWGRTLGTDFIVQVRTFLCRYRLYCVGTDFTVCRQRRREAPHPGSCCDCC